MVRLEVRRPAESPVSSAARRWRELEGKLPGLREAMVRGKRELEAGQGVPLDLDAARTAQEIPTIS